MADKEALRELWTEFEFESSLLVDSKDVYNEFGADIIELLDIEDAESISIYINRNFPTNHFEVYFDCTYGSSGKVSGTTLYQAMEEAVRRIHYERKTHPIKET